MSVESPGGAGGLGDPRTNSVTPGEALSGLDTNPRPDVPHPEARVEEFIEEYPQLAGIPLSEIDGRGLRGEVVMEERERRTVVPDGEDADSFDVEEVVERRSKTWADGMAEFLDWYERNRERYGRFGKGAAGADGREQFYKHLENSWQPGYAKKQYAQLQALARETTGGERPTGEETGAEFEEPWILFITRTSSPTPDGDPVPPVEHDRAIAEAWSDEAYHAYRNAFERLGIGTEGRVYHKQGEPHQGGGSATCYGHDHTMVVFDAAGLDRDPRRSDFEPIIDAHVNAVEDAGESAHDYETALTLEEVGEDGVADVAGYMGEYISYGEEDLLERDVEYLAWGTVQWATNTQKGVRSDNAHGAVDADRCRQRADDPDHPQQRRHGERVRREERRRGGATEVEYVCACCGTSWGIEQESTMTETQLAQREKARAAELMADGGVVEDRRADELAGRWPSAKAAWAGGESPDRAEEREKIEDLLDRFPEASNVEVHARMEESPDRAEKREKIEYWLDRFPEASNIEVQARMTLPPDTDALIETVRRGGGSDRRDRQTGLGSTVARMWLPSEVDALIEEVRRGEGPDGVAGFEREPDWKLEAIEDRARVECVCGHVWRPTESADVTHCPRCGDPEIQLAEFDVSPGSIDMRPLILPEKRARERRERLVVSADVDDSTLYTCECGVTMGPSSVANHLEGHGLADEPDKAASLIEPV